MAAWSWCWTPPWHPVSLPECSCGLSPSKLLPASSCPRSTLEGSKILIWFLLVPAMLCRDAAPGCPVQLEQGLVSQLAMQKWGYCLEPAIKKGMCTKHSLQRPCPALEQYFPGKDFKCILVFKFKSTPTKICWGWVRPVWAPGQGPGAQGPDPRRKCCSLGCSAHTQFNMLPTLDSMYLAIFTRKAWRIMLKFPSSSWYSRCLVYIWMISRCTYIYIHILKTFIFPYNISNSAK